MSAPKPDPAIGRAAQQQADLSREMAGVAREELAFGREQYERYAPMYDRLIGAQAGQAEQDAAFSKTQLDRYNNVFAPIEDRVASEAMTYDSPEESARREGLAAATVQGQFDAARDQNVRGMAAMGVSPDSGRGVQGGIDDANSLALMKAGSVNTERNNTKLMGMQLRQQAAGLGRGTAGLGLQGSQLATGAAGAAIGGTGAAIGSRGAAMAPALSYASGASQTGASAANILNQQYSNKVDAYGSKLGAAGNIIGMGARFLPIPGREMGGPVEKGKPYIVGEAGEEVLLDSGGAQVIGRAGPEVIAPARDGVVVPNHALKKVPVPKKRMGVQQPIDDARLARLEPLRM